MNRCEPRLRNAAEALQLNSRCHCWSLSTSAGQEAAHLQRLPSAARFALNAAHAHLFAETGVFIDATTRTAIASLIRRVSAHSRTAAHRAAVRERHPTALRFDPQPETLGAVTSFDFHLTEAGPQLIEINTNAGGAFLATAFGGVEPDALVHQFESEWRRAGRNGSPRTLAIVDADPRAEYLYPDMLTAQHLLERAFERVLILRPDELHAGHALTAQGRTIDMVYNRLTDFSLSEPAHQALLDAWHRDQIVVTPSPAHHALLADKRNLVAFSQVGGAAIPETVALTPERDLWPERRHWFFKPATGFGSRGAYRGSKLTRRVWERIRADGGYLAQRQVRAPERVLATAGAEALRFDLRAFAYDGELVGLIARLYRGQTTNFRTPGGGLAPVWLPPVPDQPR